MNQSMAVQLGQGSDDRGEERQHLTEIQAAIPALQHPRQGHPIEELHQKDQVPVLRVVSIEKSGHTWHAIEQSQDRTLAMQSILREGIFVVTKRHLDGRVRSAVE